MPARHDLLVKALPKSMTRLAGGGSTAWVRYARSAWYRAVMSAWSAGSGTVRSLTRAIMAAWSRRTWDRPGGATAMILASASSCRIRTAGMPSAAWRTFSNDRCTSRS